MEPIATYQEKRLEVKRLFELFHDRIRISGKWLFGTRFDETIQLANLQPQPNRLWARGQAFNVGVLFLVISIVLGGIFAVKDGLAFFANWTNLAFAVPGVYGLCCVLPSMRLREAAAFRNDVGVLVLDIVRMGPQASEFDAFVHRIVEQITIARQGKSNP